MNKAIGSAMLLIGVAGFALAGNGPVPEISASSATGALALLTGGLLVPRGRRQR